MEGLTQPDRDFPKLDLYRNRKKYFCLSNMTTDCVPTPTFEIAHPDHTFGRKTVLLK